MRSPQFKITVSRCALAMIALAMAFANPAFADKKLKIFILAGQSNMQGHANAHTMATLFNSDDPRDKQLIELVFKKDRKISKKIFDEQVARGRVIDELTGGISRKKIKETTDPTAKAALEAKVKPLLEAHEAYKAGVVESAVVSNRVYISAISGGKTRGKLGPGYGANTKKIGPEYAFGLSMAQKIDGPILLIKSAWGGKSINHNFRPPSVGPYVLSEKEKAGKNADKLRENAGLNWRMMNEHVHKVLADLKSHHPAYDASAGHEIAGFVWFQGFNDQFSEEYRNNYKTNMIAFIKDVRKEYKAPNMPFVIGVIGTAIVKEKVDANAVAQGQRAAAKAPEFKGNVVAVESYTEHDLKVYEVYKSGWAPNYHVWDTHGSDRPYHYLGSGTFFVRLGDSFATAMAKMMAK